MSYSVIRRHLLLHLSLYICLCMCVCVYVLCHTLKELSKLWPCFVFKLSYPQGDSLTPLTSINAFVVASKEQASAPACTQGRIIAFLFPCGMQAGIFMLLFHLAWRIWAACLSQAWIAPICNNRSRRANSVFSCGSHITHFLFLTSEGWMPSSLGD